MIIFNDQKTAIEKVKTGELVYGNFASQFDAVISLYFTDDVGKPEVIICKQQEWSMVMYSAYFIKRSHLVESF